MKTTIVVLLLLFTRTVFAQDTTKVMSPIDSYWQKSLHLFNTRINSLNSSEELFRLEAKLTWRIENIPACLFLLRLTEGKAALIEPLAKTEIISRLKVIADSLVARQTPILIVGAGMNSVEHAYLWALE